MRFTANAKGVLTTFAKTPRQTSKGLLVPSAKTVKSQVARLTKKVNSIAKTDVSHIKYQQKVFQTTLATALGTQNVASWPLTSYSEWTRIFGTDTDDESGKTAMLRNMNLRFAVTTNETDNRTYSLFVVKLKKLGATLALGTSIGTLTANQHYVMPPYQTGDVFLNEKYFNILYSKRWTMGVYPTAKALYVGPAVQDIGSTPGQTTKEFGRNVNFGSSGIQLSSPSGDWKAATYPPSVTSQLYVLVFCNDSTTDGEFAVISMNSLISVDV